MEQYGRYVKLNIDYQEVANKMIRNKMSIRDMADELGISKSTLHRRLTRQKTLMSDYSYEQFCELLENNKKTMNQKRWKKNIDK